MADQPLEEMTRGDDRTIEIVAAWPNAIPALGIAEGDPFPLDGKLLYFTAKFDRDQPDSAAVFQKNSTDNADDFDLRGDDNEIVWLDVNHADTENMTEKATLKCDLQATDLATSKVNTVWSGTLPIVLDTTQTSGIPDA